MAVVYRTEREMQPNYIGAVREGDERRDEIAWVGGHDGQSVGNSMNKRWPKLHVFDSHI